MAIDTELINKSMDFIIQHIDDALTVKGVASHFHFSESYFARSFKAVTGESVYEFIKRMRMELSAVDVKLVRDRSITEIGLDYGYSASNYSTAFKKQHSVSPAAFRRETNTKEMENPFYPEGRSVFPSFTAYENSVKLTQLPDRSVIYERVVGDYGALREKWPRFINAYRNYIQADTLFIERFYNDPAFAPRNACLYDVCMTTDGTCALANKTLIPGGRYAVYHYEGLIRDIFCAVQGVFCVWLPRSGYVMRERFALNLYPRIEPGSESVIMDLCIPVNRAGIQK